MADIGPVTVRVSRAVLHSTAPRCYGAPGEWFSPALDLTCELSGKVLGEDGVTPIPYARVTLHQRRDSRVVAGTYTNNAGEFAFTGLLPDAGRYFAIAFYPDGTPTKNALIFDGLTAATPDG